MGSKYHVGRRRKSIRENDLFEQPHNEPAEAYGKIIEGETISSVFLELRHDVFMVQDRAGD